MGFGAVPFQPVIKPIHCADSDVHIVPAKPKEAEQ